MKATIIVMVALLAGGCSMFTQQEDRWVEMFDGKTLNGWTQLNGTAKYTVQYATIHGRTTEGSPNSFLCSDKEYGDFELKFEVKCDTGLNSGVQIRSAQKAVEDAKKGGNKNEKEGRVFGPQVEIEGSPGQAGYVYGEATEWKWLSPEPKSDDKTVKEHSHFKNDEWNKFRVVAEGSRIQTFINGVPVADLTHEGIYETHPKGFIALQVHGIPKDKGPFEVAWRKIRIRELK